MIQKPYIDQEEKLNLLFFLLAVLLMFGATGNNSFAQEKGSLVLPDPALKSAKSDELKPDSIIVEHYYPISEHWSLDVKYEYTYDANGNRILQI